MQLRHGSGSHRLYIGMKTKPGIPNPNSPFLLGYGISQRLPDLKTTYPNINREKTPKYFIPKKFHLTASKGANAVNAPTKGTLNYCMITHRNVDFSGKEEERNDIDPTTDLNAGNLIPDLFAKTRMSSDHSDAVMAFSSNPFLQRFVMDTLMAAAHIDLVPGFQEWEAYAKEHAENKGDVTWSNSDDHGKATFGDWSKTGDERCVKIRRRQDCRTNTGHDAVDFDKPWYCPCRIKSWQEGECQIKNRNMRCS